MRFIIGIDPGNDTGLAVYDNHKGRFIKLETLDFWGIYDACNVLSVTVGLPNECLFVIENPNLISGLYARNQGEKGAARDKIAQHVGGNKMQASLLIQRFESMGFKVLPVSPQRRKKWSHEDMVAITGYDGKPVSEHCRDGARIAWEHRLIAAF